MFSSDLFPAWRPSGLAVLITAAFFLLGIAITGGGLLYKSLQKPETGLVLAMHHQPSAFPLRVEPGKRYLVDANGKPFLVHGDTAWSLIADLTREAAEIYFADRRARGFNTILISLLEHKFARKAPSNIYGEPPFAEAGNFAKPNEAYFEHADWVLKRANEMGFLVFLTPAYAGAGGGEEGWWGEMTRNSSEVLRGYGRFLGNRYRSSANIIWVNGGDYDPPDKGVVSAIAEGLKSAAPEQLHTVHNAPETSVPDFWQGADWLDLISVYTYQPVCPRVEAAFRAPGSRPAVLFESAYENEHGAGALRIRRQAYHALLCGASGHLYGNNPVWHFRHPGIYPAPYDWWQALGSEGAQSMTHLVNLFASLPWWTLTPDLDGKLVVNGRGDGDDRVAGARSGDRSLAVIYFPERQTVTLNLGTLSGKAIAASWFDPSSGQTTTFQTFAPGDGRRDVSPPGENSASEGDWVLLLRSAE
jgi:hypothetical protein